MASVGVLFGQTLKAVEAGARVFEYIDENCESNSDDNYYSKKKLNQLNGQIEFKNVSFSYPTRPDQPILENFNLTIPVGSVVAFVGSSGSGKSTIGQVISLLT